MGDNVVHNIQMFGAQLLPSYLMRGLVDYVISDHRSTAGKLGRGGVGGVVFIYI